MELDGRHIETRWWGEPTPGTPTIVLLHEGLGCVALWRDFPAALHEATGLPVFAYSRFGYGASSPVELPRPLDYMHREAALVPRILQAAGIEDHILLGHSDGATIATIFAAAASPQVRGLILIAPHFFVEDLTIASIEAARVAFETTDLRTRLARYHADPDNAFYGWNEAWLDPGFRSFSIVDVMHALDPPILALQGEADEYGTKAQLDSLSAHAPCAVDTRLLADARHAPHLSHQTELLAFIQTFINRLMRAAERRTMAISRPPHG
jgi:pimeloyl-ACP methyl ester carboxylesterase